MRKCDTHGCDEDATYWTDMDNQICAECVNIEIEEGEDPESFSLIKSEKLIGTL